MVRGKNKKLFPKWAVRGNKVCLISEGKSGLTKDGVPIIHPILITKQSMEWGSVGFCKEFGLDRPRSGVAIPSVWGSTLTSHLDYNLVLYRLATAAEIAAYEAFYKVKIEFPTL